MRVSDLMRSSDDVEEVSSMVSLHAALRARRRRWCCGDACDISSEFCTSVCDAEKQQDVARQRRRGEVRPCLAGFSGETVTRIGVACLPALRKQQG